METFIHALLRPVHVLKILALRFFTKRCKFSWETQFWAGNNRPRLIRITIFVGISLELCCFVHVFLPCGDKRLLYFCCNCVRFQNVKIRSTRGGHVAGEKN